jgi:hypothetical protein
VIQAFSIGREWTGKAQIEMALAQWNYWCRYMSDGPNGLPKPMLFHTRQETLRESFLFSMYSFGMRSPAFFRILMMPQILLFTALRFFANATSRDPVWPASMFATGPELRSAFRFRCIAQLRSRYAGCVDRY